MELISRTLRANFTSAKALGASLAAISIIAFALLPCGCSQSHSRPPGPAATPIVRVLIVENKPRAELSATEPPAVRVGSETPQRIGLSGGASATITLSAAGWRLGDVLFPAGVLSVEPASEGSVSIDGHAYRGKFRFVPKAGGKFDVVNDVDVEGYLMGVIAKELFWNWHPEAYRAQAIAARTYALYESRTRSESAAFDLFADTRSQVYGGIAAESAKSREAVEATHGMVVAFGPQGKERIFKAYFSSCCGGVTQSAAAAFAEPASEPLSAQQTSCCTQSPHYAWAPVSISKNEITRRLRIWGANVNAPEKTIGEVARIDILTTNRFGRPESFAVTDVRGLRYRLGSEDLRIGIDTDAGDGPKLPSSYCKPVNEPGIVRFTEGHGLGHGVGLCQWCAQEQAVAGESYSQIVLKAYPGAVIVAAY
ncbi:MAG TPA: SpoIID/LytB domain-containing protein [Tepidisphaeraceae bacterium]|jgi:stage II sporulation protein D|nr:SpoIID/LytB domain-containing protein [Tepidisphaeraceae bacterium]